MSLRLGGIANSIGIHGLMESISSKLGLEDQQNRNTAFGLITFLPSLLLIFSLILGPIFYILYLSFFEISILELSGDFIGVQNYIELLPSGELHSALWKGVVFSTAGVIFQVSVGLVFALALNRDFWLASLARTIALVPYLVPILGVVLMWRFLLNTQIGLVNKIAVDFGILNEPVSFTGGPLIAMFTIVFVSSWKYIAFVVLVLLARLQAIDQTLYESASVFGAGPIDKFLDITLPNLKSALFLVILLRFIWLFNKFDAIWLISHGGPAGATTTVPVFLFKKTYLSWELGMGSTISVVTLIILIIAGVLYFGIFEPSQEVETTN